jgi:UDP-N-acetylglucosamine:LPS N-acetylglucosamine transferase
VRAIAGPRADVVAVRGLNDPAFLADRDPGAARAALGLPPDGHVVLVSGGGWGVGDLAGAIDTALTQDEVDLVACLCGRNEELRARLAERYNAEPRVRVVGFTEQMSEWLGAADALIHSTGGLTVLEAYVRGCPTISYGWGRGHIRVNNAAYRRFGLAAVATTEAELAAALRAALAAPRPRDPGWARLPRAADAIRELIRPAAGPGG